MHTLKLLITAALSACSCSVFAQWQWTDEAGQKIFSDRPPPAHISQKQILKQPAQPKVLPADAPVLYPSAKNLSMAAGVATAQAQAEKKAQIAAEKNHQQEQDAQEKAQAQADADDKAQEDAKQKEEDAERKKHDAQQAKARQENCQRARAAQTSLQSGALQAHVNGKGERGLLTETQRQTELQRTQKIIKDSCK